MDLFINILIYNTLASAVLLLLMRINPRYMMQDYPKEIIKDSEKNEGRKTRGSYFRHTFHAYPYHLSSRARNNRRSQFELGFYRKMGEDICAYVFF